MEKNKKAAIVVGGLAAGVLVFVLTRKAKVEEGEATIIIQVYDSEENLVPSNSPLTLSEGTSYTVKLTVKNISTRGGVLIAATLGVGISASIATVSLIPLRVDKQSFDAGQTRSFNYTLNVPMGTGGQTGNILAWVEDPHGQALANAIEYLTIQALPIIYGATIVIG